MLFFSLADQLNTTVHGTMKTTPYELVFGQPPRHNIFPGVTNPNVMEEDILEEEEEAEEENGQKEDEDDNKQKDTMEGERETDDSDGNDKNDNQKKDVKEEDEDEKPPLSTTVKHRNLREEADKHYRLNAERMQLKYYKARRKKVLTFSPGDLVSVRIPRIDRTSTDFHRVACVVVERLGTKFHLYRLRYCI